MSTPVRAEPRWREFETADWDEAQAFGSSAYHQHRIAPATRGDAEVSFSMRILEIDGVTLGRTRYGAAIRMECGTLDDYHVLIPLRGSVRNVSGEQSFTSTPESGAIYNHSRTATVWRSRASDHLAMKLDRRVLERELSLILGDRLAEPVVFDMAVDLHAPGTRRWLGGMTMLQESLDDRRVLASQSLLAAELRNLVVLGLLVGQRHTYSARLLDDAARAATPGVARRAVRLLDEAPQHPWTIGELAAQSGSSVRALQDGFRRSIGMSPMQYLARARLDHVHRALLDADPAETTVAAIAHAWGFAHLGRFAGAYLEQFGERPSETLRDTLEP